MKRVSCRDRRTFRVPIPKPRPGACDPIDNTMFVVPSATVDVAGRWIETEQEVNDEEVILVAEQVLTRAETLAAMRALESVCAKWDAMSVDSEPPPPVFQQVLHYGRIDDWLCGAASKLKHPPVTVEHERAADH